MTLAYRKDIDGLRAVAVLSVLVFHYGVSAAANPLPGGFIGVDVFFVISGFLITSILAREIEAGEFSILGFYDRRIRRIAPALMAVLVVTLIAGYLMLMPGDYRELGKSVSAAAFGVSNFYFLTHTGYFDRAADLLPLIHTWSLGVEEQFYVVWPVLLYAIARSRPRETVARLLLAFVVAGFALSLIWFHLNPKSAFYVSLPRAWELAIGALLVFLPPLAGRAAEIATAAGLAIIVAGFFVVTPAAFPGVAALVPCVGSALVIWPKARATVTGSALGVLSPIGKISYSLYLWHWPVWIFYRTYINNEIPTVAEAGMLGGVSALLAVVSYRFVEQPFRKPRWTPRVSVSAGLAVSLSVLLCGVYVNASQGIPSRIPEQAQPFRSLNAMWDWPCASSQPVAELPSACVFGAKWETASTKAILWGDSHAEHLAPLIEQLAKDANTSVMLYLSCPAILDGKTIFRVNIEVRGYNSDCRSSRENLVRVLASHPEINLVILSSAWSSLAKLLAPNEAETKPAHDVGLTLLKQGLGSTVEAVSRSGRRVFVVGNVPQMMADPIPCVSASTLMHRACDPGSLSLSRKDFGDRERATQDAIAGAAGSRAIFPADAMCAGERCMSMLDGQFLYRDTGHIRRNLPSGTRYSLARLMGLNRLFADPAGAVR